MYVFIASSGELLKYKNHGYNKRGKIHVGIDLLLCLFLQVNQKWTHDSCATYSFEGTFLEKVDKIRYHFGIFTRMNNICTKTLPGY